MRYLIFILLLFLPVAAAPLGKKQISDRIEANQSAKDDSQAAEAVAHWEDALVALEAAEQSNDSATKLRDELAKLNPLPTPTLPEQLPENSSLKVREAFLEKVNSMIDANEIRRKEIADQSEQSPKRTASLTEETSRIRAELQDLTIPALAAGEVEEAKYQKAVQNKRRLESKLEEILAEQELLKRESEVYLERVKRLNTHTAELKNFKEKVGEEIQELKEKEAEETREVISSLEEEFSHIPELAKIVKDAATLRSEKSKLQKKLSEADPTRGCRDRGGISGRVTQIKIRATTIQQFNNRELLVPNKEFITTQLVNWTLKDSVLRIKVKAGIAYGADTEKATRILETILNDHPHVLDSPEPDVLFVSFGNSTLDFVARGFVANVEHLISAQSELHYLIDNSFREADIEIAFPQQDVHIRSLPESVTPVLRS